MMHRREKSDPAIVAVSFANEAGRPGEEQGEPRAGTKGNAEQAAMRRAQNRASMSQGLDRIREVATARFLVKHPRWEPYAGKPHVRFCAGGAQQ